MICEYMMYYPDMCTAASRQEKVIQVCPFSIQQTGKGNDIIDISVYDKSHYKSDLYK